MLNITGVPSKEDIKSVTPPEERLRRGAVAIIECFQEIPCNPCYTHCPRGSIKEMTDINEKPILDYDSCNGCGICVSACPGLAIFIVDYTYKENKGIVKIPYEFLPVPEENQIVELLDREGNNIGQGKVLKVQKGKNQRNTLVIWLEADKDLVMDVRNFRMEGSYGR